MTDEMLEILIGKYLDSEITPGEQRLLEAQLDENAPARRLLEQLQDLDGCAEAVVNAEVNEAGDSAGAIFERAWRQRRAPAAVVAGIWTGWWRFAAGVAAGIVIGVGGFAYLSGRATDSSELSRSMVAVEDADKASPDMAVEAVVPAVLDTDVIRIVDFYNFTDEAGGQWLIEGLREIRVRPVAYYKDL